MRELTKNKKRLIYTTYLLAFPFFVHVALLAYINSSFLTEFISEKAVGIIYTFGSALTIVGFLFVPRILKKIGNYRLTLSFMGLVILAVAGLIIFRAPLALALLMAGYITFVRLIGFGVDVFLESASTDGSTGSVRGVFLTIANAGFILSPLAAGLLLAEDNYRRVYFVAMLILLLILPILVINFRKFKDPIYEKIPIKETIRTILRRKNVYKILAANFMLRFFYAVMVIYTPIYLRNHIGFEWGQIGFMFTIMLLPFVLLEFPLGRLADTRFGEKEILTIGFAILAGTTAALSFIESADFALWAMALFSTRVGASMIEVMSETYFFKQIDGGDSNILSFFRIVGPLAYMVAPLGASLFLLFIDIKYIFVTLGVILLYGLRYSLTLKDTL